MPQQILIAYESLLLDTIVLSMTPHEYRYLLQHTLEKMDLSLTSAFASTFLEQALSLVVNGNDSLVMLANFRTLAVAVVEIAQGSSSSRKDILLALCTNKLSPYLTTFLNFVPQIENKMDNCLRGDSFGRLLMKQRVELGALLCSTLLKLALLAQGDGDIGINPTMALALIDKQAMLNTVIASLTHRHPSFMPAKDSRSLLQQTSTPRALQENNNWKVLLSKELQRRAEDQEDMIIQSVAQACRDFEERCEDVESPLRLQEEKTAVLQRKYEDAQNSASELEVRLTDQESRISRLETENSEYSDALREAETLGASLKGRLADLDKELLEGNEKQSIKVRQIRKEYSDRVVTVEATFAAKDLTIQTQITQLEELENAQRSSSMMLEQNLRDLEESRNREREHSQQLHSLRSELEAEKAYLVDQNEACMDAYRKIDCIDQDAKSARSALFSAETEVRRLRDEYHRLEEGSRSEINALKDSHQAELNGKLSRISQLEAEFHTELRKREAELTEGKRSHEIAAQQAEAKLEGLRNENTRLMVAKEGRERRARLRATDGTKLDVEPANQSRPRSTAGSTSSETPSSQTRFVDTVGYSSISYPLELGIKPAMKRSSAIESFKAPVTRSSDTEDPAARTRRTSTGANRPPLKDAPANRIPSRCVGKPDQIGQGYPDSQKFSLDVSIPPPNETEVSDLGMVPEYSFDENEVLTSTGILSAHNDGHGAGELEDWATADFVSEEQENE
ncbi:MAG: hypothetical protein Q9157_004087 [Trypethelium eluteriae]